MLIEGGFAWVPTLDWRLDANVAKMRSEVPNLKLKPSEYLRRNLWYATQPIEEPEYPHHLRTIFDWIGWDRMVYASDYPHWDGDWPHTIKVVRERKDLSDDTKRKMLHDNVARFYKLADAA